MSGACPGAARAVLKAEGLSKAFTGEIVFEGLSLSLFDGEILCLVGPSGIGKTTLFNILSGLIVPDSGAIALNGRGITGVPGHVAYMQQKDLLFPYYRVLQNVALPLVIKGWEKNKALTEAAAHFNDFGLENTESKYPHELSGGMRQRAALLRTYLQSEGVALLDEPFGALDAITRRKMHEWYLKVMEKIGLSTIFITHDIDEAVLLSDRILVMAGAPAVIGAEIRVESPRSARRQGFELKGEFLEYKRRILKELAM